MSCVYNVQDFEKLFNSARQMWWHILEVPVTLIVFSRSRNQPIDNPGTWVRSVATQRFLSDSKKVIKVSHLDVRVESSLDCRG